MACWPKDAEPGAWWLAFASSMGSDAKFIFQGAPQPLLAESRGITKAIKLAINMQQEEEEEAEIEKKVKGKSLKKKKSVVVDSKHYGDDPELKAVKGESSKVKKNVQGQKDSKVLKDKKERHDVKGKKETKVVKNIKERMVVKGKKETNVVKDKKVVKKLKVESQQVTPFNMLGFLWLVAT